MKVRNNRKDVETVNGYISKERAEICVMSAIEGSEGDDVLRALDDVRLAINSEPAANVAPVVCGHWKNVKRVEWGECSNCGRYYKVTRYCPYCGTEMSEREDSGNE